MTHRQPTLPPALRILALGCVVLWLAGTSACNLERLFCCDSHGDEVVAPTDERHPHSENVAAAPHAHEGEAQHSDDAEGHSHGSHKHKSKEESCCSTLKAVVQTAEPIVLSTPACHPISFLSVLLETHAASFSLLENPADCQTKDSDRVFTPEVCLGPAHRGLAPPSLV